MGEKERERCERLRECIEISGRICEENLRT
jgi:hypothetical protein